MKLVSDKPWSAAEDATLRAMRRRGDSYAQIARALQRTRNSVMGRWDRLTVKRPRDKVRVLLISRQVVEYQPAEHPFAPDNSCPNFAWDDDHCAAVQAAGGFPVLERRVA